MILDHIDISGFRGINQLSLPLTMTNLLIGENAWGKSSLLDAFSLMLDPASAHATLSEEDFHFPAAAPAARWRTLQIVVRFRACEAERENTLLQPFWQHDEQGSYLRFSLRATCKADGVKSSWRFIDARNQLLAAEPTAAAISWLRQHHPVLRLRDARFGQRHRTHEPGGEGRDPGLQALQSVLQQLNRAAGGRAVSDEVLLQGVQTMQQLMAHYFLVQQPGVSHPRMAPELRDGSAGWQALDALNRLLAGADAEHRRAVQLRLLALLPGSSALPDGAQPVLLVEDPETRLHPIMLSVTWNLLTLLPLQRLVTTNSGELVSQTPLENLCRLVREASRVAAWRIGEAGLSAEDHRRIAFHIRVNRPAALFARCWLLVEGETEVWIVNELARQQGDHFAAEGIRVIEFAQAGLKPLLKFARRMGIAWHVLTDGDEAGKKYAATTRSQLLTHEKEEVHLTQFPAADIEHFLYQHGFRAVYHQMAHLPLNIAMTPRRIITQAIHHSSKPELAIAVALAAGERGPQAIPPLFRTLFSQVKMLAQRRAG